MAKRCAIVPPLGLAFLLAIGAGVALALAVHWLLMVGEQVFGPERVYQQIAVLRDGTPVVISFGRDYYERGCQTLDGEVVPAEKAALGIPGTLFRWPEIDRPDAKLPTWYQRIVGFSDQRQPATYWYFVHDGQAEGAGYFVGFDSQSKLCVGYISSRGFRSDEAPRAEWFPVDGRVLAAYGAFEITGGISYGRKPFGSSYYAAEQPEEFAPWVVYLAAGPQIVAINLRTRTSRVRLEVPDARGVGSFYSVKPGPREPQETPLAGFRRMLAIRTPDRILALLPGTDRQETLVIPVELRQREFSLYDLGEGKLLAVTGTERAAERSDLYWIDSQGNILRHREVTWDSGRSLLENPGSAAWVEAVAMPAPLAAVFGVTAGYVEDYRARRIEPNYPRALVRAMGQTWLQLLLVGVVAAAMAWLCYRRQQRYALPWTRIWVVFVFLGGVPGLIGYLVHRRWPPLEACGSCGELVPRDRGQCARCGADVPPPAPKGIEVFAA